MRLRPRHALALLLVVGLIGPASASAAPGQLSFSLVPVGQPKFRLSATPGRALREMVGVDNHTTTTRTIVLRPADVTTSPTGGLAYGSTAPKKYGKWIRLSSSRVTVAPGATASVPFTVKVPKTAKSGQHFAGIVGLDQADIKRVKRNPKPKPGKPIALKFLPRFAVPVTVTTPGKLKKHIAKGAYVVQVTPQGAALNLSLTNTGNSLIEGSKGSVTISQGPQALVTEPITLSQFVPDTTINYPLKIPGLPVSGATYDVRGTLQPQGAQRVSLDGSATFSSDQASQFNEQTGKQAKGGGGTPLWQIGVLLLVLLLAIGLGVEYMRLRRQAAE